MTFFDFSCSTRCARVSPTTRGESDGSQDSSDVGRPGRDRSGDHGPRELPALRANAPRTGAYPFSSIGPSARPIREALKQLGFGRYRRRRSPPRRPGADLPPIGFIDIERRPCPTCAVRPIDRGGRTNRLRRDRGRRTPGARGRRRRHLHRANQQGSAQLRRPPL